MLDAQTGIACSAIRAGCTPTAGAGVRDTCQSARLAMLQHVALHLAAEALTAERDREVL
jgi:hypothetical protein